ncbi:DUF4365 domain-containing protein [Lachnospiraceae bacterium 54-53]
MPNMDWKQLSALSKQRFGAYGEYYVKMEFLSYGFDVFSSEVDNHGINFVCIKKDKLLKIQVRSVQKETGYVYTKKKYFDINDKNMYLCLLIFENQKLPDIYLIPAVEWKNKNELLKYHAYEEPEYGINISNKNMPLLNKYQFESVFKKINCK